jgi:4-alpha-glucanotransferase
MIAATTNPITGARNKLILSGEIRDKEKQELLSALRREGLDPSDGNDYHLSLSVHAFLARSGAAIAMVQLEDLVGETLETNLPATSKEHPNWRNRLSKSLEELGEGSKRVNIRSRSRVRIQLTLPWWRR